LSKLKRKCS